LSCRSPIHACPAASLTIYQDGQAFKDMDSVNLTRAAGNEKYCAWGYGVRVWTGGGAVELGAGLPSIVAGSICVSAADSISP
jgi:hypothetical protein